MEANEVTCTNPPTPSPKPVTVRSGLESEEPSLAISVNCPYCSPLAVGPLVSLFNFHTKTPPPPQEDFWHLLLILLVKM